MCGSKNFGQGLCLFNKSLPNDKALALASHEPEFAEKSRHEGPALEHVRTGTDCRTISRSFGELITSIILSGEALPLAS